MFFGFCVLLFRLIHNLNRKANMRNGFSILLLALVPFMATQAHAAEPESAEMKMPETVVLLHGMGRSRASLWLLGHRLRTAGYKTLNFPYAAATTSMDELSDNLRAYVEENVQTPRYHFVAHSLGNIIIRNGFHGEYREGLGRIVMLAPPNTPQKLAIKLKDNALFKLWNGDSGGKLASDAFYADLPVPSVPFGVIAADKGQKLTFDAPNDGIVLVETTKLEGMADWVLVHHSHTFMMNSRDTAEHVLHFLAHGKFAADATKASP